MSEFMMTRSDDEPADLQILPATDRINAYWQIGQTTPDSPGLNFALAVNQTEIRPKILVTDAGTVFVGAEQAIYCLKQATGAVLCSADVTYVQDIELTGRDQVLVSAEDGVLLFSKTGEFLWRDTFPSLIVDVREIGDIFEVELDTGDLFQMAALTGEAVASIP